MNNFQNIDYYNILTNSTINILHCINNNTNLLIHCNCSENVCSNTENCTYIDYYQLSYYFLNEMYIDGDISNKICFPEINLSIYSTNINPLLQQLNKMLYYKKTEEVNGKKIIEDYIELNISEKIVLMYKIKQYISLFVYWHTILKKDKYEENIYT